MSEKSNNIIVALNYIIESVRFREKMRDTHNCNDCGAPKGCMYRPAWGQPVRWNCPHWKEMK